VTDDLDPVSPVPRYLQIAAIIRARIERGELQPGDPIPSQITIIQTYGVARATAAKALKVLKDEGAVVVVPGVRALVARRK
jgi:GntR family transcriptional regulator